MPGKSRRKDKFSLRNKAGNGPPAAAPAPAAVAQEPVVRTAAAASAGASARNARPSVIPSSLYVNREILTISLLAVLMLVLLVAAALIAR